MAFDWFFRGGFKGHRGPDLFQSNDDIQDCVDIHKNEKADDSFDVPFMDPFGTLEDTSLDIFQRMDDMLSRMFSSTFASFGTESFSEDALNENDPRAVMLKEPSCEVSPKIIPFESKEPSLLIDSDIDDRVAKHGLLLDENQQGSRHNKYSYRKISSFQTVRLPDGTFEEHRTVTDSQGNSTTTVRRSIGEQSYEVTTESDATGLKEKQENFINLDENDLSEFEKRWQSIKERSGQEKQPLSPAVISPAGDPLYSTLFKKFFRF